MKIENPAFIAIDLFCGAGGTTTGFDLAEYEGKKLVKVIACVNHDAKAIESHWKNHPDVVHFEEDILILDLIKLSKILEAAKTKYPEAKVILWASLECTNFSKAKGGQPRDADSRTLAWGLIRYIEALNPDFVMIENVVEFMSWGPLDNKGKPISRKNGIDWIKWREFICSQYNYIDSWKEMNSADFGAYTSRNRLFGIFSKDETNIAFPLPTHAKNPEKSIFGDLKKWKAVKDVLDFEDEGTSIFNRKIPIVDASLERIYAGLIKFVAGGEDKFILKYNSMNQNKKHNPPSVSEPCPTIACQNRLGLVSVNFIAKYYSGRPEGKVFDVESPVGTITTIDHHSVVSANFLVRYNKGDKSALSILDPSPTLLTKDRLAKIDCSFIVNPSYGGNSHSINVPCPVIVARQDKAPLYFVQCEEGNCITDILETDSEIMVKIKEFMILYNIIDIKIRMLKVMELKLIQGFSIDYILSGNQSEQKKFIGNSVVPLVVKKWIESIFLKSYNTYEILEPILIS